MFPKCSSSVTPCTRLLPQCWYVCTIAWGLLCLSTLATSVVAAEEAKKRSEPAAPDLRHIRQIYVPEDVLGAWLQPGGESALVTVKEFERLLEKARASAATNALQNSPPVISGANYQATISGQRLVVAADVSVTSFAPHAETSLAIAGWSVESASLGDQPALLARMEGESPRLRLFLPTAGTHLLKLQLSTPLQSAGSDQLAGFHLLGGSSGKLQITLPAGKFLQANGKLLTRPSAADQPADYAVAVGGQVRLELTITDRQQETRTDSLTFASTAYGLRLQPGEMTWSTTTLLQVFGHQIDQLICHVPRTLEVTTVQSDGLESWQLDDDPQHPDQTRLTLKFRSRFDGDRKIQIRGLFSPPMGQVWEVPQLKLDQVTTHTGFIHLNYADQIRLQPVDQSGVRTSASLAPNAPSLTGFSALAFEIWREDFALRFVSTLKESPLQAAMTNVLFVRETELQLSTSVSLMAQKTPLFEIRLRLPANFQIRSADVAGQPIDWQIAMGDAGFNEIRLPLNQAMTAGQIQTVNMTSISDPENWPIQQAPVTIALPQVKLIEAGMVEMLYGICAPEILEVAPIDMTGLDPASQAEIAPLNARLQAEGEKLRLGFAAQEAAYQGQLQISRRPGALTVETISDFKVDRETVVTHAESQFSVSGGGMRTMTVEVSEAAGDQVRFQLRRANATTPVTQLLEQVPGAPLNGFRPWTLSFDRSLQGEYRLDINVSLPRGTATEFSPIELRFPQAISQSGYLAIEGSDDEEVKITDQGADGKPLQAVDPVDFPNSQVTSGKRIVAGYRYAQPGWSVKVSTTQFARGSIPPAIGHALKLTTVWNDSSTLQQTSTLNFYAVGMQNLLVTLPEGARLWSALLDGRPVELRNGTDAMSVPLSQLDPQAIHELTLLYDAPEESAGLGSRLTATPPQFSVTTGTGQQQPLSILEQTWDVHYPPTTLVVSAEGPFQTPNPLHWYFWVDRVKAIIRSEARLSVASGLMLLFLGGVVWFGILSRRFSMGRPVFYLVVSGVILFLGYLMLPGVQNARESARRFDGELANFGEAVPVPAFQPSTGINAAPVIKGATESGRKYVPVRPFGSTDPMFGVDKLKQGGGMGGGMGGMGGVQKELSFFEQLPINKSDGLTLGVGQRQTVSPPAPASSIPTLGDASDSVPAPADEFKRAEQGRLSIAAALEIPQGLRHETLIYRGNRSSGDDVKLQLCTADRETANRVQFVIIVALAGVAWCLRKANRKTKGLWAFFTIALPVALISLVTGWSEIITTAVLVGGLLSLGVWGLHGIATWLEKIRTLVWIKLHPAVTRSLLLLLILGSGSAANAEDKPAPVPAEPYVVIPYKSLQDLDSANRVWIPPQLFQTLWKEAHPELSSPPAGSIPAAIAEATYVAEVKATGTNGSIEIKARWVAINLTNESQTVPLPVRRIGLQNVTIAGESAALTVNADQVPAVVLPTRGVHVIDAVFTLPADVSETVGQFTLETTPVAAGKLIFLLPKTAERLRVRANGGSSLIRKIEAGERTEIQIPVDRGGRLTVAWQPEAQQTETDNVVHAESNLAASFSDAGVNMVHQVLLTVRQGSLGEARFQVPAGVSIRRLEGTDVARWDVSNEESGTRELTLQFRRQVTDQTKFQLELFQPLDANAASQAITLGIPAATGITREVGMIGIASPPELRITAGLTTGLQQVDTSTFSQELLPVAQRVLCYRFSSRPLELKLNVVRKTGEVRVVADHAVSTGVRKLNLASRLRLTVTDFPRRQFEIALPQGYQTHDVNCPFCTDWYVNNGNGEPRLTVELDQPRTGEIEIKLEGTISREAASQSLSIAVPTVAADRATTTLAVWVDPSEQLSFAQAGDWRSIAPSQLPQETKRLRSTLPQFAFTTNVAPQPLQFEVRKILPELQADAAILIAAGDATVDYGLTLRWTVSQSAADTFAMTVPTWLGQLDFEAAGVRQIRSEPAEKGLTRWIITSLEPVRDQFLITAAATIALPVNQVIETPQLNFQSMTGPKPFTDLQTQRQFAVMVNLSSNQLSPVDASKFEPLAADELPLTLPGSLVQQAMDIVRVRPEKWPTWRLQRPDRLASSRAIVLSAALTTVLQQDGSWRTKAVYGVRNRGQQFLALKLPADSDVLSVIVRDEPSRTVLTKIGEEPLQLIPLPQTSAADLSFDVVLVLSGQLPHALPKATSWTSRQLAIPSPTVLSPTDSPEFGVSTAQTSWNVYVPEGLSVQPVTNSKLTNVTWHQGAGWLEAELLALNRFRSDLAELKQILTDSSQSVSQRGYAQQNMQKLRSQLESQQSFIASERGTNGDANRYLEENGKLLSEMELPVVKQIVQPRSAPKSQLNMNRAFIAGNNLSLQSSNQLKSESTESSKKDGQTEFFSYSLSGNIQESKERRGDEAQQQRSRLKSQLQEQVRDQANFSSNGLQQPAEKPAKGQDSDADGSMVGRTRLGINAKPPGFSPTLDVPFRQGSFDLAAPSYAPPDRQSGSGQPAQANAPAGPVPQQPAEKWTAAGGLSIPVPLPVSGQEMAFSRIGGNPELTLRIRGTQWKGWLAAIAWTACCLAATAGLIWLERRTREHRSLGGNFVIATLVVGAAGFILVPFADRFLFLLIFCIGLGSAVYLSQAARTTQS